VSPGAWTLNVKKAGYAELSQEIRVSADDVMGNEHQLKLQPTEGLYLEVRLPGGRPPGAVRAFIIEPSSGTRVTSGTYETRENGRVRIASAPPGNWELLISGAGSAVATLAVTIPGPVTKVTLGQGGELRVTVAELSEDSAISTLRLLDVSGKPYRFVDWQDTLSTEERMARGHAVIQSLPAGEWKVEVSVPDGRHWEKVVQIKAGASTEATF
jgi:hypothetical protein